MRLMAIKMNTKQQRNKLMKERTVSQHLSELAPQSSRAPLFWRFALETEDGLKLQEASWSTRSLDWREEKSQPSSSCLHALSTVSSRSSAMRFLPHGFVKEILQMGQMDSLGIHSEQIRWPVSKVNRNNCEILLIHKTLTQRALEDGGTPWNDETDWTF